MGRGVGPGVVGVTMFFLKKAESHFSYYSPPPLDTNSVPSPLIMGPYVREISNTVICPLGYFYKIYR